MVALLYAAIAGGMYLLVRCSSNPYRTLNMIGGLVLVAVVGAWLLNGVVLNGWGMHR